jgi:hypothetical protein
MISYLEAINLLQPEFQVTALGEKYTDINWRGYDVLSQASLDAKILEVTKQRKIIELSEQCENAIMSGFQSAALGQPYVYDSEQVDQINLIGAVSSTAPTPLEPTGYTIYYACRNVSTGVKEYHPHSHFQLRQILADGAQVKLGFLQVFHFKRLEIESCTTIAEVNAIIWSVPW